MSRPLIHILSSLIIFQPLPILLTRPCLSFNVDVHLHAHAPLIRIPSIKSYDVPTLLTNPDLVSLSLRTLISTWDIHVRVHFDSNHSLSANPRTAVMFIPCHAIFRSETTCMPCSCRHPFIKPRMTDAQHGAVSDSSRQTLEASRVQFFQKKHHPLRIKMRLRASLPSALLAIFSPSARPSWDGYRARATNERTAGDIKVPR